MKYAIISDIHGNLSALELVLNDAKNNNVDCYIFVGDYFLSNPFPNECMNRIRNIDNKYIIRGNEEAYLENLIGKDQRTWLDGQMQISYYCYKAVSEDNLQYVLSLPHAVRFSEQNVEVYISHSSRDYLEDCEHDEWTPEKLVKKYSGRELIDKSLHKQIHAYMENDEKCKTVIRHMNPGIYIFGHTHIQWSWQSEDGKVTLINPGSCGLPLDGKRNSVPYTILEICADGKVSVEEKRIPFDMEEYIQILRNSDQSKYANVWTKIIEKELKTGLEHLYFFLCYVEEYANKIGDIRRPYAVDTWEEAYKLWETEFRIY